MTSPDRPLRRRAAPVLAVVLLLGGCGEPTLEVTLDGAEPGLVGTTRCIAPVVSGSTPLPADVTQASSSGLQVCIVGFGDATRPGATGMVTAVEFTVQNPGSTPVDLPADTPLLQAAPYGPASVVAPQGRVLPERLEAGSAVTARVLYDYTAEQRAGAQVAWADVVFQLPE